MLSLLFTSPTSVGVCMRAANEVCVLHAHPVVHEPHVNGLCTLWAGCQAQGFIGVLRSMASQLNQNSKFILISNGDGAIGVLTCIVCAPGNARRGHIRALP